MPIRPQHFFLSLALLTSSVFAADSSSSSAERKTNALPAVRTTKIFDAGFTPEPAKNPAISVHTLLLGRVGRAGTRLDTGAAITNGASVQDLAVQMSGELDGTFAGTVTLGNFANTTSSQDFGLTTTSLIREAFAKTISLPVVSFKAGQFLANFGKNNRIYPHAQPMIDQPLIVNELFGANGFRSAGVSMELLIPTTWFFDIDVALLSGNIAGPYSAPSDSDVVGVFRMEHEFSLSQETNFGFGVSGSLGRNSTTRDSAYLGVDMSLKYALPGGFGFAWFNEMIHTTAGRTTGTGFGGGLNSGTTGFYSNPMFRFAPKFWAGLRFDFITRDTGAVTSTLAENVMVAWVVGPSSTLRFQGGFQQPGSGPGLWTFMAQYNMTIGSHPAHAL